MKLSKKAEYGLRALFDIAYYGRGQALQTQQIAERQEIPLRFLEQIFQDLKQARLVVSKRGPKGGYVLGRAAEQIRFGDILRAVDGPQVFVVSASEGSDRPDAAVIAQALRSVSERAQRCFDELTIAELCDNANRAGVRRGPPKRYVYAI